MNDKTQAELAWTGKMCTHEVFMDVDGAFDQICYKAMIRNLSSINTEGKLPNLFRSYLSHIKPKNCY